MSPKVIPSEWGTSKSLSLGASALCPEHGYHVFEMYDSYLLSEALDPEIHYGDCFGRLSMKDSKICDLHYGITQHSDVCDCDCAGH